MNNFNVIFRHIKAIIAVLIMKKFHCEVISTAKIVKNTVQMI